MSSTPTTGAVTAHPPQATQTGPAARTRAARLARLAGLASMICPGLFFTVMMVLGQVTPHYDWVSRFGSELALGRYGWAMIANFLVLGLAVTGLAAGPWHATRSQRSGRIGAAAIAAAGIAFLVAGTFVTDPAGKIQTVHGMLHVGAALVLFFAAIPTAAIALAVRYRASRAFACYSAVTALATPALFLATFLSGHLLGLTERILIGTALAWLTAVAIAIYGAASTARHAGDPGGQGEPETRSR